MSELPKLLTPNSSFLTSLKVCKLMTEKTKNRIWTVVIGVLIAVAVLAALPALLRAALPEREIVPVESAEPVVYTLESYAAVHGYKHSDYPEALVELYEKNPDARRFVLEYPAKKDLDPEIDLSEEIAPGEVPELYQWDERWGYRTYNGNFMARSGCGPTALSMAIIGLTGNTDADPWTLAQYAEEHHYNVPDNGTSWAFIPEAGAAFGLRSQVLAAGESSIRQELESGRLVLCCVGPGDFTDTGHFLLVTGVENGMYRVHDPNSPTNTAQLWTYDRIVSQIRGLWSLWKA